MDNVAVPYDSLRIEFASHGVKVIFSFEGKDMLYIPFPPVVEGDVCVVRNAKGDVTLKLEGV